jgi:hypothetical protein
VTDRGRRIREILAVVLTGAAFLAYENVLVLPKLPFLLVTTAAWGAYLVLRIRRDPSVVPAWGLGRAALAPAARAAGLVAAGGAVLLLAYRLARGWTGLPPEALLILALYPVWGFVQQFAVQALVAGNLARLGLPKPAVIVLSAVLFGLAHLPDWPLVALCASVGVAWTWIFLRSPHLVPLALSHALLGTLAYYWVLERDPWREMFPAG